MKYCLTVTMDSYDFDEQVEHLLPEATWTGSGFDFRTQGRDLEFDFETAEARAAGRERLSNSVLQKHVIGFYESEFNNV